MAGSSFSTLLLRMSILDHACCGHEMLRQNIGTNIVEMAPPPGQAHTSPASWSGLKRMTGLKRSRLALARI
jgi:hypothetical protein